MDQFLRIEAGRGEAVMGPSKDQLDFIQEVSDDWVVLVPAGMWHDVRNTGDEDLKIYAIYAPVHHAAGIVQATAADAERDEEEGRKAGDELAAVPGMNRKAAEELKQLL